MTSALPWPEIDTVLLDMDGTLLDLHFDNHFWLEYLPRRYAEHHGISFEQAFAELEPRFLHHRGQLNWYCLDFWSRELELPIRALKAEIAHLISLRPDADTLLQALKASGRQVVLTTNAHPGALSLKMERINLQPWLDRIISAHDYGYPKEDPTFWQMLQADLHFDPERTLFVDDSLPVLQCARDYGIRHLRAIEQPDSRRGIVATAPFEAIRHFTDLIESLPLQR